MRQEHDASSMPALCSPGVNLWITFLFPFHCSHVQSGAGQASGWDRAQAGTGRCGREPARHGGESLGRQQGLWASRGVGDIPSTG